MPFGLIIWTLVMTLLGIWMGEAGWDAPTMGGICGFIFGLFTSWLIHKGAAGAVADLAGDAVETIGDVLDD